MRTNFTPQGARSRVAAALERMDALLDHANGLLAVGDGSATAEACRADMCAIRSALDETEQVCAEAYQVVGVLLNDLGIFDTERATKILDNLAQARLVHEDVLPWPSTPLPDLITIRKPTTRQEAEWLAKIAHLLVKDINQTLDELLATPEQKDPS